MSQTQAHEPEVYRDHGTYLLYPAGEAVPSSLPSYVPSSILSAEQFEPEQLAAAGKIQAQAQSQRGAAWLIKYGQTPAFLRRYRRGGLIGKFIKTLYWWSGLAATRPWREWQVMAQLSAAGHAVPRPLAARIRRRYGFFYEAEIIMSQIPQAQSLTELITQQADSKAQWQAIGRALQQVHQAGLFHADLNPDNILLDAQGKVWLVDLDRSELREPAAAWQQSNLNRLVRGLNTREQRRAQFSYRREHWQALLVAYVAESA